MSASKTHSFFSIVLLFIISQSIVAQDAPFITLIEESTTGKYTDTIPSTGVAIVDINSIIHINIENAFLENEMFLFQGISGSDERLKQLKELNTMLSKQNMILKLINDKFSDSPKWEDYQKLAELEIDFFEGLSDDIYNELSSDENEEKWSDQPEGTPYIVFAINIVKEKADKLRKSMMDDLNEDEKADSSRMTYFRLGAFLKNKSGGRPIHVENFDDISTESYTEVARFGPPISKADKEKLDAQLAITKKLNDSIKFNTNQATEHLKQVVKARIKDLLPSDSLREQLKTVYDSALKDLKEISDSKQAIQILNENESDLEKIKRVYSLASSLYSTFAENFPKSMLDENKIEGVFAQFDQSLTKAYTKFSTDVKQFQDTANSGAENLSLAKLKEVESSYQAYANSTTKEIKKIKASFENIKNMLNPFRKSYIKNEEFTEKVSRFTAGKVPPTGFIEIKAIGERKAGDEILIKAVIERGRDRSSPDFMHKELYRRYISMERIAAHLKMSGSLILANPYNRDNEDVKLTNSFQFAPSYGIFLKWGSRKSKFYNNFLSFGVGLGLSSPDFNLDGTPEFGAGIMTTVFKDIVSAGWGWNFGIDAAYYFVGFNIPFTVTGLQSATPGY